MKTILAVSALLALGACAGDKTLDTGQRMSARADNIAARGSAWSDGQDELQKGQKMLEQSIERVAEAEKNIRQAQSDRAKGEQLISSGTSRMQQAEADYNQIRSQPSAITP